VSAEVERWVAGLRSGEVKTAVARAAEELEKWLKAVKSGRYAYHSSGQSVRICAEGVCAVKTRGWAIYFKPVRVEAGKAGEAKEKWIVAKSPEELEAWLSRAGSVYVAPALFFKAAGWSFALLSSPRPWLRRLGGGWRRLEEPAASSTTPWPPQPDAAS
jgi:hypothetical protein